MAGSICARAGLGIRTHRSTSRMLHGNLFSPTDVSGPVQMSQDLAIQMSLSHPLSYQHGTMKTLP